MQPEVKTRSSLNVP